MAVVSGVASAGLLAIVNSAAQTAHSEGLNYRYFAIYIVLFLLFFVAKKYSIRLSSAQIEKVISKTRDRISNKIAQSELSTIERFDSSTLFTRLTRDTSVISQASFQMTGAAQAVVMVFFAMLYIFSISTIAFVMILLATFMVVSSYFVFLQDYNNKLKTADQDEERFIESLTSIVQGFKEIKMNSKKRTNLLNEHNETLETVLSSKLKISDLTTTSIIYSDIFLYSRLAAIVFIAPHFASMEAATITKLITATLFIIAPFSSIVVVMPVVSKTNVAISNIYELEAILDKEKESSMSIDKSSYAIDEFKGISLQGVNFYYLNRGNEKLFSIGPIDLEVKKGETIFIVGGNGSGKSTMIKVLLGLYFPKEGNIMVNDEVVDDYNYQAYRDLFSIILTDFHLFKRFYGLDDVDLKILHKLLVEMQLHKKTKYVDGAFTTTDLSTGQRKRLALIRTFLEDKPICVFDEWAADQDPEFRKYFYRTILKRLKEQGKTVIAVTHDDAYFDAADRIYKMVEGKLIEI